MTRKLIPRLRRPAVLAWALAALFVLGMGAALWLDELARQAGGYVGYGLVARPGTLPATGAAVVLAALSGAFNPEPLDPPRQAVTSPLAVDVPAGPLGVVYTIGGGVFSVVFGLAIVAGVGSLVVRFRRARGVERQQLRWVALAAALVPVVARREACAWSAGGWRVDAGEAGVAHRLEEAPDWAAQTVPLGQLLEALGVGLRGRGRLDVQLGGDRDHHAHGLQVLAGARST